MHAEHKLNLRTPSVSDGHDLFTSPSSLPVPVAHARGSQIYVLARHENKGEFISQAAQSSLDIGNAYSNILTK